MKQLLFLFIILSFVSCKKDQDDLLSIAPPEIKEHVQTFIAEADKRGVKLNTNSLVGFVLKGKIEDGTVNGLYNHDTKIIYFDTTSIKFKRQKEALVFHELAHSLLSRGHDSSLLINGDPKSIMHPNDLADYELKGSYHLMDSTYLVNNYFKRDYYISELFNINTPSPFWANN